MRKILVVLVAVGSLLTFGCEEGKNTLGGGACVVGTTAVCTTNEGQSGSRTCDATGAYGECVAGGGQCVPNTVNSCVTACTTVGTQTCSAAGIWGISSEFPKNKTQNSRIWTYWKIIYVSIHIF